MYRSVIMFVVQAEERNMYDQHLLSLALRERYPFLFSFHLASCVSFVQLFTICIIYQKFIQLHLKNHFV